MIINGRKIRKSLDGLRRLVVFTLEAPNADGAAAADLGCEPFRFRTIIEENY